jgi:hypothetical protein
MTAPPQTFSISLPKIHLQNPIHFYSLRDAEAAQPFAKHLPHPANVDFLLQRAPWLRLKAR